MSTQDTDTVVDNDRVSDRVSDAVVSLKNTGNAHYATGDYTSAIKAFSDAVALMKERLTRLDESLLAITQNRVSECVSEEEKGLYEESVRVRSEEKALAATLFCNRGMCYSGLGEWQASAQDSKMVSE